MRRKQSALDFRSCATAVLGSNLVNQGLGRVRIGRRGPRWRCNPRFPSIQARATSLYVQLRYG